MKHEPVIQIHPAVPGIAQFCPLDQMYFQGLPIAKKRHYLRRFSRLAGEVPKLRGTSDGWYLVLYWYSAWFQLNTYAEEFDAVQILSMKAELNLLLRLFGQMSLLSPGAIARLQFAAGSLVASAIHGLVDASGEVRVDISLAEQHPTPRKTRHIGVLH